MKEFTKGEIIVLARSYNGRDSWTWARVRVRSCGNKQMTLENLSGEMLGRNYPVKFDPMFVYEGGQSINPVIVMKNASDSEIEAKVMEFATITRDQFVASCNKSIAESSNPAYIAVMQKHLEEVKEPSVFQRFINPAV